MRGTQGATARIINATQDLDCDQVGLRIDSHDPEYFYWDLLGAPSGEIRIESIYPVLSLGKYLEPEFKPCAIVCTVCLEKERIHGLDLVMSDGNLRLFAGDTYSVDPDR